MAKEINGSDNCHLKTVGHRESISEIFKLNIDCFEELFDWLTLRDLKSLRQSCKRLKVFADFYIKTNYPTMKMGYRKLNISHLSYEQFCNIAPDHLKLIKEIHFLSGRKMHSYQFGEPRDILAHVESIKLGNGQLEGELHEDILKYCKNLKFLSISNIYGNNLIGTGNQWLRQQYPSLEHIELKEAHIVHNLEFSFECSAMRTFLELNPNIRTLSISAQFLRHCGDGLKGTNIELDQLIVYCNYQHDIQQLYHLLNELHRHGFYRRLLLGGTFCTLELGMNRLMVLPNLEKISVTYIDRFDRDIALPPLENLNELNIGYVDCYLNLEALAESLINVKRIEIVKGSFNSILAFVRHSTKVKEIRIDHFMDAYHFNLDIKGLQLLNAERKKLDGARKITIFIEDKYYIALKWTIMKRDFNLIGINRKERW